MKIEIKKINAGSVLFSVFPLAVFAIMVISAVLDLANAELSLGAAVLASALLRALIGTFVVLIFAVIGAFVYNFLSAIGIRGVRVELDDVE